MFHVAYGCGMKVSAVDAAFSKHSVYREGYLHLLTTKDGDNKTIALAWAICETESGDTYDYFLLLHQVPRGRFVEVPFRTSNHLQ